jgi:hypothetical protein
MDNFFSYLSGLKIFGLVVLLMTGILALIREWIGYLDPDSENQRRVFWTCIRSAFIIAAVWLWIAEVQQVITLQQRLSALTVPNISGEFGFAITNVSSEPTQIPMAAKDDDLLATFSGYIRNNGAPTVLSAWGSDVVLANGTIIHGREVEAPSNGVQLKGMRSMYLPLAQNWRKTASEHEVSKVAPGWMQFMYRGISKDRVIKGPKNKFTLSFKDLNGRSWTLEREVGTESDDNMPLDINTIHQEPQ